MRRSLPLHQILVIVLQLLHSFPNMLFYGSSSLWLGWVTERGLFFIQSIELNLLREPFLWFLILEIFTLQWGGSCEIRKLVVVVICCLRCVRFVILVSEVVREDIGSDAHSKAEIRGVFWFVEWVINTHRPDWITSQDFWHFFRLFLSTGIQKNSDRQSVEKK